MAAFGRNKLFSELQIDSLLYLFIFLGLASSSAEQLGLGTEGLFSLFSLITSSIAVKKPPVITIEINFKDISYLSLI